HLLLGECYLKSKRPKDALRSFKMVLFLSPNNEKAQKAVRTLESLTADEYEEDLFEMKQLPQADQVTMETATTLKPMEGEGLTSELERILSLSDAYIVRNDLEKANEVLRQGEAGFGAHPELVKRFKLVNQRNTSGDTAVTKTAGPIISRERTALDGKISMLQDLLGRIRNSSQFT
ncbi:MAG: tetratricopeptide repeat protein, partial [Bdellovibrionales bacterium]